MKNLIYFILIFGMLFISCRRDEECKPLDDEKSLLIGEWEWDYSVLKIEYNINSGNYYYDTIYNDNVDYNHSIVFEECGQVFSLKNDLILNSYFIRFNDFNLKTCEDCFDFIIFLNGNSENRFFGYGDVKSIVTNENLHPVFKDREGLLFSYNYYKKL